jgi:hypothetical protein
MNADPTIPGTRAHARWHKDDSPGALAQYESRFITHAFLHPHEVVDAELHRDDAGARATARRLQNAGHTREPQARTFRNSEGLATLRGDEQ